MFLHSPIQCLHVLVLKCILIEIVFYHLPLPFIPPALTTTFLQTPPMSLQLRLVASPSLITIATYVYILLQY